MMKKILSVLVLFCLVSLLYAQSDAPVALMLAYQQKFEGVERFSGTLRWQKQDGEIFGGNFVVEGEKFHITWDGGELYGDGEFEWEVLHRSHRIKKRFYDPLIAPAVVNVFRLLRLDMTAEPVMINQKDDQIVIEVEFGSSVIQGNHFFKIDPNTLLPESLKMNVAQDSYFEKTDVADLRWGDDAAVSEFSLNFEDWKKKGYSLLNMAKGDSDVFWPEERALK